MKRNTILFSFYFSCSLLTFAQNENSEFRATWVITWEHIDRYKVPGQNMQTIRSIMDDHVMANMNAVIFQVRQSGTAYYESSYEPWGYYSGYQYPGYDPLAYAIEQAHQRGLELHAWFNVFQTSSTYPGSPVAENPEWVCRDQSGNAMGSYRSLSPGLQDVRDYTLRVAMEIVRDYDIDGLHLDYVRWNEHTNTIRHDPTPAMELKRMDGTITPEQLELINKNLSGRYLYDYLHPYSAGVPDGFNSWEEWWRWSVTEFVRTLHDSIQAVKPHVRLSAAVLGKYNWSGWQGYGTVYQDGALWYNEGYLDHIMPMHYHWTTANGFLGMLDQDCPECWELFIQPGIGSGRPFSVGPGSYILDDHNVWNNHYDIVSACRSLDWVDGFQFFSYGTWDDHSYFDPAGTSFFKDKTKIPLNPIHGTVNHEAPILVINPLGELEYELTVYPPSGMEESGWIIIYRSLDPIANQQTADIVDIHFSKEDVKSIDILSVQDTANTFLYFATIADRYWNESDISNIVFSTIDPIPDQTALYQNYPNPFNAFTTIEFSIPKLQHFLLKVWSLDGKEVQILENRVMMPGRYTTEWYGKNEAGKQQSSGVYLYSLSTGNKILETRKLVYVK